MTKKRGSRVGNRFGKASSNRLEHRKATRGLFLYFGALLMLGIGMMRLNTLHTTAAHPLNSQGLRVAGTGRSDGSRVLSASLFSDPDVRNAYRIAAELSAILNKLYCWCGCIERGMRSNLQCFETTHAATCDICLAGAEVAAEMRQRGITDPAQIQRELDSRFGPPSA